MSNTLPSEVNAMIYAYTVYPEITISQIQKNARNALLMYLLTKCSSWCQELARYQTIYHLLKKYNTYQIMYESDLLFRSTFVNENASSRNKFVHEQWTNPILCDILFSGLNIPYSRSAFDSFTDDVFNDLLTVLKYIPNSLHSTYCHLRCRTRVTPLYIACINEQIPIFVVKLLLNRGANKDHRIHLNGCPIGILTDIRKELCKTRYAQLVELFDAS